MKKKHIISVGALLLTIMGTTTSCLDDLDKGKITSEVDMNMGVILPMANADLTLLDFADPEKYDAVKYFDESFAKDLLRFQDGTSEIYKSTIFSLLGMDGNVAYSSQAMDYDSLLGLGSLSFDGEKEITKTVNLKFRVNNQYDIDIKKLQTSMDVEIESSACTAQCEFGLAFAEDKKVSFQIPGDSQKKSLSDVTMTCTDGYITIPLTIKATVKNTSRIGSLVFKIVLTDLKSFVASAGSTFKVDVPDDIKSTGMHGFKRFQGTVKINDPKLILYTTNTSALNIKVSPRSETWDDDKKTVLSVEPFTISSVVDKEEHVYSKSNCDIQYVFEYLPEKISVGADLEMNMPKGVDEVEVTSKDEVIVGYMFDVPAQMSFKGSLEAQALRFEHLCEDAENIERARVIAKTICTFPFHAKVRIDFINKNTEKAFGESLYIDMTDIPVLDKNGISAGKGEAKEVTQDLTAAQVKQLRETKELLFNVVINDDQDVAPMVWLQKNNQLTFNVTLAADYNIDNK